MILLSSPESNKDPVYMRGNYFVSTINIKLNVLLFVSNTMCDKKWIGNPVHCPDIINFI